VDGKAFSVLFRHFEMENQFFLGLIISVHRHFCEIIEVLFSVKVGHFLDFTELLLCEA